MKLVESTAVTSDNLLHEVALLRQEGYRLVTLTCLHTGDGHDILYHFDQRYVLRHLRLHLKEQEALVSISSLFPAAMIVENEIKDHFGVNVTGLAVDFQGRLMLTETAPRAPMNKVRRCGMDLDARVAPPTAAAPANPPSPAPL